MTSRPASRRDRRRTRVGRIVRTGIAALLLVSVAGCSADGSSASKDSSWIATRADITASPSAGPYEPLSAEAIEALPEARYDAVIPGLSEFAQDTEPTGWTTSTVSSDAPLYGEDLSTPVARLAASNFLDESTVVVVTRTDGPWAEVLTPARRDLPSERAAGASPAAAQTSGWIRADLLADVLPIETGIVIRVADQTLTVVGENGTEQTFPAGVGAPDTPTPTGVVGYLQARYLDPAQGQEVHPIQLTSLHATGEDEPFGGSDGGLIGIHFQPQASGAVSHGCIRLAAEAIDAVDAVPLGTTVTILP